MTTHVGSSLRRGHYTAVVDSGNGEYLLFDDSSMSSVSEEKALKSASYMIFYEVTRPSWDKLVSAVPKPILKPVSNRPCRKGTRAALNVIPSNSVVDVLRNDLGAAYSNTKVSNRWFSSTDKVIVTRCQCYKTCFLHCR